MNAEDLSAADRDAILRLVRQAIRDSVAGRPPSPPSENVGVLAMPCGCFVSLHRRADRALRGCVGRLSASAPLARTLCDMAAAALRDPRFESDPVRPSELAELEVDVNLLSPLSDGADPLDFDPRTHGIYLTIGRMAGCFLPEVARQTGWTREQLLSRLCTEKMGLDADAWRSPLARLRRFTAVQVGPAPVLEQGADGP